LRQSNNNNNASQSMVWCQTAVAWFGATLAVVWFGAKLLLDGLAPNCRCCCRLGNKPISQWFGAKLLLYGLVPNWLLYGLVPNCCWMVWCQTAVVVVTLTINQPVNGLVPNCCCLAWCQTGCCMVWCQTAVEWFGAKLLLLSKQQQPNNRCRHECKVKCLVKGAHPCTINDKFTRQRHSCEWLGKEALKW
jgi:hypothetical protein